jgi:ribosomal protein S18 acetylase RimI-like enzyme
VTVRTATPADRSRAVRTALRAFAVDPLIRWFFPDDVTYESQAGALFGTLFDLRVDGGEVRCTDDVAAVAMWDRPGGHPKGQAWGDRVWEEGTAGFTPEEHARFARLGAEIASHKVDVPTWYLGILATHPDWQRLGLASAILEPVLSMADADGLPAALLTATPENVAYYRRQGFTVHAETDVPALPGEAAGPHVWTLRREPR